MSTAALIKSINEHASRQHQQLRAIQDDMEVLAKALVSIIRLGTQGQQGDEHDARIRGTLVQIAREAILAVHKEDQCEPL